MTMNHPKYKIVNRLTGELATYSVTYIESCPGHFGGPWGSSDEQTGEANYICVENVVPIDQLKTEKIQSIKQQAFSLLSPTDYKVNKFVEGAYTEAQFEPIKVARQAIRDKSNELEALVVAAQTKEELEEIVWA